MSIHRASLMLASIIIVVLISAAVLRNSMQTAPQTSTKMASASELMIQTVSSPRIKTARILISNITLIVELAETQAQWIQGLSDRDSMPSNHGMLFIFSHESKWSFWMKEMKFPLDIIWFNSDRKVVYTERNLLPCGSQDCPVFTPPVDALYVLEVNAGFVEAHNISLGDTFTFLEVCARTKVSDDTGISRVVASIRTVDRNA